MRSSQVARLTATMRQQRRKHAVHRLRQQFAFWPASRVPIIRRLSVGGTIPILARTSRERRVHQHAIRRTDPGLPVVVRSVLGLWRRRRLRLLEPTQRRPATRHSAALRSLPGKRHRTRHFGWPSAWVPRAHRRAEPSALESIDLVRTAQPATIVLIGRSRPGSRGQANLSGKRCTSARVVAASRPCGLGYDGGTAWQGCAIVSRPLE